MAVLGDMKTGAASSMLAALALTIACSEVFVVGDEDSGSADATGQDSSADTHAAGQDAAGQDAAGQDAAGQDAAGQDAAGQDAAGADTGAPRDPCEPPNPCSGTCELPWLLAAAQDAGGRAAPDRCGGHVFRYSLAQSPACACPSYSLGIEELPQTVSYIPGGTVLVGTQRRAYTFGTSSTERSIEGQGAIDSFIVEGENIDSPPVGVLLAGRPGDQFPQFFVFGSDGSFEALPRSGVRNVTATQNPANRRGYRGSSIQDPSINRLFWEGGVEGAAHIREGGSGDLEAFYANGFHRTTLVGDEGVRHLANATLTLDNAPSRVTCTAPEYDDCVYRAAAPDPTSEGHVYVACAQPSGERSASRIARLDVSDGSCVDLLPFEHWPGIGVTHLSVGLEDYWAP